MCLQLLPQSQTGAPPLLREPGKLVGVRVRGQFALSPIPVRFARSRVARAVLALDRVRLSAVVFVSEGPAGVPEYVFYRDGLAIQRSADPFLERASLKREDGVYWCDVLFPDAGVRLMTNKIALGTPRETSGTAPNERVAVAALDSQSLAGTRSQPGEVNKHGKSPKNSDLEMSDLGYGTGSGVFRSQVGQETEIQRFAGPAAPAPARSNPHFLQLQEQSPEFQSLLQSQ